VKELVEQNHAKYESYGLEGGVFSAGLKRKERHHQVTFASAGGQHDNGGLIRLSEMIQRSLDRVLLVRPQFEMCIHFQSLIAHGMKS
jgi:hypothetical protein